jgi:ribosomal protein L7Ae-like RNA K-turn-binding protein
MSDILKKYSDSKWQAIVPLLHFAVKAGGLKLGMSASCSSCLHRKAKLIICADNLSGNSQQKIVRIAQENRVKTILIGSKEKFADLFNRNTTGIICVENVNIAQGITKLLAKEN